MAVFVVALVALAGCDCGVDEEPAWTPPQAPEIEAPSTEEARLPGSADDRWGERPEWASPRSGPEADPIPRFGGVWVRRHVETDIDGSDGEDERWGDYRVSSCARIFEDTDDVAQAIIETAEHRLGSCSLAGPAHVAADGALVVRSANRVSDYEASGDDEPVEGPHCWLRLVLADGALTVRGFWPGRQCSLDWCGYHGGFDEEDSFPEADHREFGLCPDSQAERIGEHVFRGP